MRFHYFCLAVGTNAKECVAVATHNGQCRSLHVAVEGTLDASSFLSSCVDLSSRQRIAPDEQVTVIDTSIHQDDAQSTAGRPRRTFWDPLGNAFDLTYVSTDTPNAWRLADESNHGVSFQSFREKLSWLGVRLASCRQNCEQVSIFNDHCDLLINCQEAESGDLDLEKVDACELLRDIATPRRSLLPLESESGAVPDEPLAAGPSFSWDQVEVEPLRRLFESELESMSATYCTAGESPRTTKQSAQEAVSATAAGTMAVTLGATVLGAFLAPPAPSAPALLEPAPYSPPPRKPCDAEPALNADGDEDAEALADAKGEVYEAPDQLADSGFTVFLAY